MGLEALGAGDADDRVGLGAEGGGGELEDAGVLDEVPDAERGGEAGGAGGGEDVAGAGRVVAGGLGGVGADEDGAGAVEAVEQGAGVVDQQLQVFGGGRVAGDA